jgi:hypothetical protein
MAQLLQYQLSDGQIWGIYTSNTQELLEAQIVDESPTYGYLFPASPIEVSQQESYEILSGAVSLKTTLVLTAHPSPFVADGVTECSITVSPFVACTLMVNGIPTALVVGDQTLVLTADTPQQFQVHFLTMPGYWAADLLVRAVAMPDATPQAAGRLSLTGANALTGNDALLAATGGPLLQGSAILSGAAATVSSTTSLTTLLSMDLLAGACSLMVGSLLDVVGQADDVMAPWTVTSVGTLRIQGTLSVTGEDAVLLSSGVLPLRSELQTSLDNGGLEGAASLSLVGAGALLAAMMVVSADGSPPRLGTGSLTMAPMTALIQGA